MTSDKEIQDLINYLIGKGIPVYRYSEKPDKAPIVIEKGNRDAKGR